MSDESYALLVRDAFAARMKALTYFATFHFSTNKSEQIQPQSIPFAGVYFITERTTPDGDANVGEVRFRTMATIGFSVIVQNNDAAKAELELDKAWLQIASLFCDQTLYNNAAFKIQGFLGGSRTNQFGSIGLDNEMPIAEMRYELTCDLGTITYPPLVPDSLETIHITTQFPLGGTPEEIAAVQQVKAEFDLPQNEE